jgi:hypothetical protein
MNLVHSTQLHPPHTYHLRICRFSTFLPIYLVHLLILPLLLIIHGLFLLFHRLPYCITFHLHPRYIHLLPYIWWFLFLFSFHLNLSMCCGWFTNVSSPSGDVYLFSTYLWSPCSSSPPPDRNSPDLYGLPVVLEPTSYQDVVVHPEWQLQMDVCFTLWAWAVGV